MQLFHGDADPTISYKNFGEAIKEWTNVLGLATNPTSTTTGLTLGTHQATRQQWKNSCGYVVLDAFTSIGGDHGPSDALFNATYVVPFLGLDQTGAVDPEIAACGGGSDAGAGGATGAGGARGMGGAGGTVADGGVGAGGSGSGGASGAAGQSGSGGAAVAGQGGSSGGDGIGGNSATGGSPAGNRYRIGIGGLRLCSRQLRIGESILRHRRWRPGTWPIGGGSQAPPRREVSHE